MNDKAKVQAWEYIINYLLPPLSVQNRTIAVQQYIAEGGPVPNELGEKLRKLLTS